MIKDVEGAEKKLYGLINPDEISFGRLIGAGSFGEVFQGEWRGTEVAIKVLLQNKLKAEHIEAFKKEIAIMVELRHPNIVLYMGVCLEGEKTSLVCELMHQGSLYDVLHEDKPISYHQRLQFMSDISKGMQYLHMSSPPIIHRDLKSLNILVDDRSRLKVSDFGLTTIQGEGGDGSVTGSLLWLAPEVINGEEYKQAADVYSFGIIVWEIISRKDPYYEIENAIAVTTRVLMEELRPTMPPNIPQEIQGMIVKLWSQSPEYRPTFQEASRDIAKLVDISRYSSNSSFAAIMNEEEIPPEGNVCVVSSRIFDSEKLWEDIPESMGDAVLLQNSIFKTYTKKYHGYISLSDGGHFLIIFQDAFEAVRFCSEVQVMMKEAEWSADILEHDSSKPLIGGDLRGLRVQMGIDFGVCNSKMDSGESKKKHYSGKCITTAIKLSRACLGGQIRMTEAVYQAIDEKLRVIENENLLSEVKKEANGKEYIFYEVYPKKLGKRLEHFTQLNQNLPSLMISSELSGSNLQSVHLMPNTPHQSQMQINDKSTLSPLMMQKSNSLSNRQFAIREREKMEWEIAFEEVKSCDKEIGSGSFGTVYVGEYKGRKVAVKKIMGSNGKTMDESHILFLTEVSVIRKLKHKNIVEFIGASAVRPNLVILMEYVEPGNLREVLRNQAITIDQSNRRKIINGIIDGMAYLHSLKPPVLHRDLKSANILITHEFESKICDFGFARVKANNRTMTKCGTIVYQAPEVMKGEKYNEKADVYSFGILLWEVETRETPYKGKDPLKLQFEVLNGLRPPTQGKLSGEVVTTIKKCWDEKPEMRPSFQDLAKAREEQGLNIVDDF